MARYRKGSDAERELIGILFEKGFSVVRAAGSGKSSLPSPDIVAMSRDRRFAFECKAWDSQYLSIPVLQMEEQLGWAKNAAAELVIAWKMPRQGFIFLFPNDFVKASKNYAITRETALKKGLRLEVLLGLQSKLELL